MSEDNICSQSGTIGIKEIRNLLEVTNTMKTGITMDEYAAIMAVYGQACDRILKENGLE